MRPAHLAIATLVLALGACSNDEISWRPTPCTEGDTVTRACGNCGTSTSTCVGGAWTPYASCTGEGPCAPGTPDTASCGTDVGTCSAGTMARVCTAACAWSEWGGCGGAYVPPAEEVCGNGLDENCDGSADEYCDAIAVSGQISKLISSPDGSTIYALNTGTPSQVVVVDVATRTEVARIALPQPAHDFDLSPNGQHLIVAHDVVHQLSKIDVATRSVLFTRPVASDPYRVEVNDAGVIYYVELNQWVDIRRVNASVDFASDTLLGSGSAFQGDIELSPDGSFLYVGDSGTSGGSLLKYDVSAGGFTQVDESTWDDGYGFPYPARHLYLGPDGQRVYYASHQLDASYLAFTTGATGGRILAEDGVGTLAVGTRAVLDARTLRAVGELPRDATCATFANRDTELWYYSAADGHLYWIAKTALGDGALGRRDLAAEPLSSYALTQLVRDPIRPRLYGLDPARNLVVAIDADTREPLGVVLMGSTPTDLAISLAGDALYVGHFETLAVARIDLDTFAFDRFVVVPREPYEIEPLSSGRLAIIDEDQWTTPAILDPATGAILASKWGFYEGALAATADGSSLFVAESSLSGSNMFRYSVGGGAFTLAGNTTYDGGYGFPYPPRHLAVVPDGSAAYYAGFLIDGSNLAILRYVQSDPIVAMTPDGLLATSSTKVYRVSDGALLGTLPVSGSVQAVSADGATLYVSTPGAIQTVDLGAY